MALAVFYPLAGFVAPRRIWVHVLPLAAALLVIFHLILEGYRWQMVPVYVVIAVMARVGGRLLRKPAPRIADRCERPFQAWSSGPDPGGLDGTASGSRSGAKASRAVGAFCNWDGFDVSR